MNTEIDKKKNLVFLEFSYSFFPKRNYYIKSLKK